MFERTRGFVINSVSKTFLDWNGKMKLHATILVLITAFILGSPDPAFARSKLSKAEVQQIVIGKTWHNKRGKFIFRSNGTYQYDQHDGSFTWRGRYTLKSNGLVKGEKTSYRFYRKKDGTYQYFHSRSRKYFPVIFY